MTRGQAVISRFAPSPTGALHLGHAFSALLAHDAARRAGGKFLIRIEDIDTGRCRADYIDAILEDLDWLGLDWDAPPLVQSTRGAAHAGALAKLKATGLVYRCVCTRTDIAAAAGAPQGAAGPIYPGTCRDAGIGADRPGAWRIDVARAVAATGPLTWHDHDAGLVTADPASLGDVVVARRDAATSYHLAATVDDAAQGVTHVVRGHDLFAATHVHRLLQALLDLPTPEYRHHALVLGPDGRRLAKRTPGATIGDLRAAGVAPERLVADLRERRLPIGFRFDRA